MLNNLNNLFLFELFHTHTGNLNMSPPSKEENDSVFPQTGWILNDFPSMNTVSLVTNYVYLPNLLLFKGCFGGQ